MTIITKPITEKKLDKTPVLLESGDADRPKLGFAHEDGDVESSLAGGEDEDQPHFVLLRARARRISSATTLCLFLTALVVMSIGIIGGVYLYRQYALTHVHRFQGWCNIPYTYESNQQARISNTKSIANLARELDDLDTEMDEAINDFFREKLELDLDDESYEKIDVPDFQGGRKGRFIHDFNVNKTGIIDIDKHRCFVMPLNRGNVLPPRSLFDLIQKIWNGHYEVNTEIVRETMRVVTPPLTDIKEMGAYINRECRGMDVYKLEQYVPSVYKRSIHSTDDANSYVIFAGRTVVINIKDLP